MDVYEGRSSQIRSEDGILKQAAAGLRREATPAEKVVWENLRGRRLQGLRFRRQHVLHGYIVDFYCHEKRLCIELDGAPHLKAVQNEKDRRRDFDLESKGYKVLRIMNEDALRDMASFRDRILEASVEPNSGPPL